MIQRYSEGKAGMAAIEIQVRQARSSATMLQGIQRHACAAMWHMSKMQRSCSSERTWGGGGGGAGGRWGWWWGGKGGEKGDRG